MQLHYLQDTLNNSYSIKLIKKKHVKKLIIKPDYKNQGAIVSIPRYYSYKYGLDFAKNHLAWLRTCLKNISYKFLSNKAFLNILGIEYPLVYINPQNKQVRLTKEATQIIVSGNIANSQNLEQKIIQFYKQLALQHFSDLVREKAVLIQQSYNKISIKDTKSKWGSCSSSKNLSFNFRLMMSLPYVTDYVAAHEVAHLIHLNHKSEFWNLAFTLAKHPTQAIEWLKQYGTSLYWVTT